VLGSERIRSGDAAEVSSAHDSVSQAQAAAAGSQTAVMMMMIMMMTRRPVKSVLCCTTAAARYQNRTQKIEAVGDVTWSASTDNVSLASHGALGVAIPAVDG